VAPVLHRTRASCAALRIAEELRGGAGTSSTRTTSGPSAGDGCRRRGRLLAGSLRSVRLRALTAGLLVAAAACGTGAGVADSEPADTSLRFGNAQPTLDALGRHVLQALARRDTVALNRVRLTEHEHNDVVWPELPASAPEVNFPVDYAWTNIQNRNTRSLTRLLRVLSDRNPTLQRVECRGGIEEFETFVVRTDCWVVFAVDGSPELWEAQLFKDVLERAGGHKVFRYYDEEPRPYATRDRAVPDDP
jgi:hypothetical protein